MKSEDVMERFKKAANFGTATKQETPMEPEKLYVNSYDFDSEQVSTYLHQFLSYYLSF